MSSNHNPSLPSSEELLAPWQVAHHKRRTLSHLWGWVLAATFFLPWYHTEFSVMGGEPEGYFFIWDLFKEPINKGSAKFKSLLGTFFGLYAFMAVGLIVLGFLRNKLAWRTYIYAGFAVGLGSLIGLWGLDSAFSHVDKTTLAVVHTIPLYCALIGLSLGCDLRARYPQSRISLGLMSVAAVFILYLLCIRSLGSEVRYIGELARTNSTFLSFSLKKLTSSQSVSISMRVFMGILLLIIPLTCLTFVGLLPAAAKSYGFLHRLMKLLSLVILAYMPFAFVFISLVSFTSPTIILFVFAYFALFLFAAMQRVEQGFAFIVETLERKYLPPKQGPDERTS